jgi:sortase A
MDTSITRKLTPLLPIALIVALFAALNAEYIHTQLAYLIRGPEPLPEPARTLVVPGSQAAAIANLLTVPSLGIQAPIQYVTSTDEASFQRALQDGVVHYPGTADPGDPGNVYIFGHSSDYAWSPGKFKTVLALLPRIKPGDEIQVSDKSGKLYRYRVLETRIVSPKDLSVLDQHDLSRKLLTLQTSYPVGTALRRFLAVAELVSD